MLATKTGALMRRRRGQSDADATFSDHPTATCRPSSSFTITQLHATRIAMHIILLYSITAHLHLRASSPRTTLLVTQLNENLRI